MTQDFHDATTIGGGRERGTLISSDRVEGTVVYNSAGDKIGTIDSIMIDKISGEVAYVVMSFGGFLGIGEKFHPLPWDTLDYDTQLDGYRVDVDRDQLSGAPSYEREELSDFDYERGHDIDTYYGQGRNNWRDADNVADDDPNRSDRNDGIDRPLGFFSSDAQSVRNTDRPGAGEDASKLGSDHDRSNDGFYSPEQQAARNTSGNVGAADVDGEGRSDVNTDRSDTFGGRR